MSKVNYRNSAYVIRFLMILYCITTSLGFVLTIVGNITKIDFSIPRVDYGYRDHKRGYIVKTNAYFDIPDTVLVRQTGTLKYEKRNWQQSWINEGVVKDTIINHFRNFDITNSDQIINFIGAPDQVNVSVNTDNNFHRWFYIIYDRLPRLFFILVSFWIIILINNYLKADFFKPSSYKLITKIGMSFIFMNVIMFIFLQFSLHILPDFNLNSVSKGSGLVVNHLQIKINTTNKIDPSYLLIGLMILIFSEIIKNAIQIKKDQDLTI